MKWSTIEHKRSVWQPALQSRSSCWVRTKTLGATESKHLIMLKFTFFEWRLVSPDRLYGKLPEYPGPALGKGQEIEGLQLVGPPLWMRESQCVPLVFVQCYRLDTNTLFNIMDIMAHCDMCANSETSGTGSGTLFLGEKSPEDAVLKLDHSRWDCQDGEPKPHTDVAL